MNLIEVTRRAIDAVLAEEMEAVKDWVRQELQAPSREEVAKLVAEGEIAAMKRMEQEAGLDG